MTHYPGSYVTILCRDTSDHCPCLVAINIDIPKTQIFRFENYWMLHDEFMQIMEIAWHTPNNTLDQAKRMVSKLKNLRCVLRKWQQHSNLAQVIDHNKAVIFFMDVIEEFRDLSLEEWNFRKIIQRTFGKSSGIAKSVLYAERKDQVDHFR
jgi:hypothetical protein